MKVVFGKAGDRARAFVALVMAMSVAACHKKSEQAAPQMPPPSAVTVALPEPVELFDLSLIHI